MSRNIGILNDIYKNLSKSKKSVKKYSFDY